MHSPFMKLPEESATGSENPTVSRDDSCQYSGWICNE
jgi:hypothetical protein